MSAGQGEVSLTYRSSLGEATPEAGPEPPDREVLAAALLSELARMRPQEVERGVSLVGPHRDDVVLALGGLPVKGYASHGESWSMVLALDAVKSVDSILAGWNANSSQQAVTETA